MAVALNPATMSVWNEINYLGECNMKGVTSERESYGTSTERL